MQFQKRTLPTTDLFQELLHWRFLDTWTGFLPWRPEYHYLIRVFSDASNTGWGGILYFSSNIPTYVHSLWRDDERSVTIATREALALVKTLHIAAQRLSIMLGLIATSTVRSLLTVGGKEGTKSWELTEVLKQLFHQTVISNFFLHLYYVRCMRILLTAPLAGSSIYIAHWHHTCGVSSTKLLVPTPSI